MASATPSWSQSGMIYSDAAFTSSMALPIASGSPRVAQHRAVVFRVADGDRRADRDVQTPAQRLQAAALVDAGGIDLHARALTRDDPCGRTLHAREELGALGRVRKVKVELLDRVRRGKEARSISSAAVPLALKLST